MIVDWLEQLFDLTPDCTVDTGGATFFGATPSFNFCYLEQSAPNVWNVGITTFRFIFGAGMIFFAYKRLFDVLRGLGS